MQGTVNQGVILVVDTFGNKKWYRVTRQKFAGLVYNMRHHIPNFKYAKLYEIVNYSRKTTKSGGKHQIGNKIGWITRKGEAFEPAGIYESASSNDWYNRHKKPKT